MEEFLEAKEMPIPLFEGKATYIYYNIVNRKNSLLKSFIKDRKVGFNYSEIKGCCGITCVNSKDGLKAFVFIKHTDDLLEIESVLVHENTHLAQDILEYKGVEFKTGENNESYAYLAEHLYKINVPFVRECYNKLKEKI